MDIEEAKEHLRIKIKITKQQINNGELWLDTLVEGEKKDIQAIEIVLSELEKKEAVINEMSKYVNSPLRIPEEKYCEFYHSDEDCCWKTDKDCKDCIKEYFTNKVEKEGKQYEILHTKQWM